MRLYVGLYAAAILGNLTSTALQGQTVSGAPAAEQGTDRKVLFRTLCQGCHGAEGAGGDRGPALVNRRSLRVQSVDAIKSKIQNGTREGMPAFHLPDTQATALAEWIKSLSSAAIDVSLPGDIAAGERFFFGVGGCSTCHMVKGRGGVNGPDLSEMGARLTVSEIEHWLDAPEAQAGSRSAPGCPPWAFCPDESYRVVRVKLKDGTTLRGFAKNQGRHDLQLQTFDGQLHSLLESEYESITRERESAMKPLQASVEDRRNLIAYLSKLGGVDLGASPYPAAKQPEGSIERILNPKRGEWTSYHGDVKGNRHSLLDQINTQTASHLEPRWMFSLTNPGTQTTPLVMDGIMYVTAPNEVDAIDARTGSPIWHHHRENRPSRPLGRDALQQPNRGAAILGDRIFYTSGDAHLICLNRTTGAVMWEVVMPDVPGPFSATSAPLIAGGLVIAGIAGGDLPLRGFVDAYDPLTGKRVWRFWTIPAPGEKAAESWKGNAIGTGGGATWFTGAYDNESDTLYWTTGNPFPATDGDERGGSNLYTDCVLALNPHNGQLRWHYQFTPHDLHDWDATEPVLLIDTQYRGEARKLLLQANRNGFFYVLDRISGKLLLAKPFVKKLNWASGVGPDGQPQLLPANHPTKGGIEGCPAVRGATNWYATAWNPQTRLMYVMAVEDCSIYTQSQNGGYAGARNPANPGVRYLRALDIETGAIVWEIAQPGSPEENYSGVLSSAGGVLFYGETGGTFAVLEAKSGRTLWTFDANASWRASPMTYMIDGEQYVAIAAGQNILSFALPRRK